MRPLCELLGIAPGGYSRGLEQAVVDFGAEDSFGLAAERLGRHHPVKLCATSVRKITLRHAQAMQSEQQVLGSVGTEKLDYSAALVKDLPLGSGMIESGHRHVLQKRLKLSGAWRAPPNLAAMAQLRVCRANNHWNQYWANST
jgi:hypothetical protein